MVSCLYLQLWGHMIQRQLLFSADKTDRATSTVAGLHLMITWSSSPPTPIRGGFAVASQDM